MPTLNEGEKGKRIHKRGSYIYIYIYIYIDIYIYIYMYIYILLFIITKWIILTNAIYFDEVQSIAPTPFIHT